MLISPKPVTPDSFGPYGEIAERPSGPPTAEGDAFSYWSDVVHYRIDGSTEIGYCSAFPQPDSPVPWVERHARTPELIIPIDGPLALPVMGDEATELKAFYVEPGDAVIIDNNVWHGACHPAVQNDVTYFVIFRRGTPQNDVSKQELQDVSLDI